MIDEPLLTLLIGSRFKLFMSELWFMQQVEDKRSEWLDRSCFGTTLKVRTKTKIASVNRLQGRERVEFLSTTDVFRLISGLTQAAKVWLAIKFLKIKSFQLNTRSLLKWHPLLLPQKKYFQLKIYFQTIFSFLRSTCDRLTEQTRNTLQIRNTQKEVFATTLYVVRRWYKFFTDLRLSDNRYR